jgi:hypothetical protein
MQRSSKYYIVKTTKSLKQVFAGLLGKAVKRHDFGVLHVHGLGAALLIKGIAFDEQQFWLFKV